MAARLPQDPVGIPVSMPARRVGIHVGTPTKNDYHHCIYIKPWGPTLVITIAILNQSLSVKVGNDQCPGWDHSASNLILLVVNLMVEQLDLDLALDLALECDLHHEYHLC